MGGKKTHWAVWYKEKVMAWRWVMTVETEKQRAEIYFRDRTYRSWWQSECGGWGKQESRIHRRLGQLHGCMMSAQAVPTLGWQGPQWRALCHPGSRHWAPPSLQAASWPLQAAHSLWDGAIDWWEEGTDFPAWLRLHVFIFHWVYQIMKLALLENFQLEQLDASLLPFPKMGKSRRWGKRFHLGLVESQDACETSHRQDQVGNCVYPSTSQKRPNIGIKQNLSVCGV